MSQYKNITFVKRILEYNTFKKKEGFLYLEDQKSILAKFKIQEVYDDFFLVRLSKKYIEKWPSKVKEKNFIEGNFIVRVSYLDSMLSFITKIFKGTHKLKLNKNSSIMLLKNPLKGEIIEHRMEKRFSLRKKKLGIYCEIKSAFHDLKVETMELLDLSQTTISFMAERKFGIALPNDEVDHLILYSGNKTVLDTKGKIIKMQKNENIDSALVNPYLYVIQFTSPSLEKKEDPPRQATTDHFKLDIYVKAFHPVLTDHVIYSKVSTISKADFSITLENIEAPIIPRMILDKCQIQLPFKKELNISIKILSVIKTKNEQGEFRYIITSQFLNRNLILLNFINQIFQLGVDLRLSHLKEEELEKLWCFFFQVGFIYTEKRKQLEPYTQDILSTYEKIVKSNTPIFRSILLKKQGHIIGHCCSVLFFDRSWLMQHAASLNQTNENVIQTVMHGILNHLVDDAKSKLTDGQYLFAHYRPNNVFVSIIYEEPAFVINDLNKCGIHEYIFCLRKTYASSDHSFFDHSSNHSILVYEAKEEDFFCLENLLISQGYHHHILMEGLNAENLYDLSVQKEYKRIGLYRYRRILIATSLKTGDKAFAVCNYCSPGISLSELTNSFKLYFSNTGSIENQKLADRVCEMAFYSYNKTQMKNPILLLEKNQPLPSSFHKIKLYNEVYYKLEKMQNVEEEIVNACGNMRYFLKKRRHSEFSPAKKAKKIKEIKEIKKEMQRA